MYVSIAKETLYSDAVCGGKELPPVVVILFNLNLFSIQMGHSENKIKNKNSY
jgi:hypothetical protein